MIGSNVAVDASIIQNVFIQTLKQIAIVEYTRKGAQRERAKYVRGSETWKKMHQYSEQDKPLAFTARVVNPNKAEN